MADNNFCNFEEGKVSKEVMGEVFPNMDWTLWDEEKGEIQTGRLEEFVVTKMDRKKGMMTVRKKNGRQ